MKYIRQNKAGFSIVNFQLSISLTFITLLLLMISSCTNPFAPKLADSTKNFPILSDQKNPDGVFQNFRYSYIFKDTLVYGKLLSDNFTFVYRNYDLGVDNSWGRDEDMLTTNGLFQATQNLDLIWNEIVVSAYNPDSLTADISRGFTLTVTFSPTDIIRVQGRVNLRLARNNLNDIWKILIWRDESNY
jgi:hypothetical protein